MTTIGQFVKRDQDAGFRNDVQLDAYDKPHNLSLLRSYLFTANAPTGWSSSLNILEGLIDTFNSSRIENRIVAIANYGHGKSHLALAIANYFGRPKDSQELKVLFNKIEQTASSPAEAAKFISFKKNGGKYMVLMLRGDIAGSMRSQFIREIERVLDETPETHGTHMPFWFSKAETLLNQLTGENLDKANAFLSQHNIDVPELLEDVRARKMQSYDHCVGTIRAAFGFAPDFGDEISLKQILTWASEKFCGTDKPFRGILILFDEFSLYLYNYAARSLGNELQDLMNGVSDLQQKVVFLAFAQQDPIEYVQKFISKGTDLDTIQKELGRIPRKMLLYSLMESVIDSYLNQDNRLWDELLNKPALNGWFTNACDTAFEAFSSRYRTILRWTYENFRERVAKGCFPLHPMTTALLCNTKFQDVSGKKDPRTVLGFVLDQLDQREDQSIIDNGRPNWILPVELVDFFNEQLASDRYRLYDNARRKLGPDAPEEQKQVLKALLLHDIAELKGSSSDQINLVATMAGLDEKQAKGILLRMAEDRVILQNPITKRFTFWTGGLDISDYDRIIQEKIANTVLDMSNIQKLGVEFLPDIPVSVEWGKPDDWAAKSILMLTEDFTVENVAKEITAYKVNTIGITTSKRGMVFWILAKTDTENNSFLTTAHTILDKATAGKDPVPVLVVLPRDASPNLITTLIRRKALLDFSRTEHEQYKEMYTQDVSLVKSNISKEMHNLSYDRESVMVMRPKRSYLTTSAFTASIIGIGQATVSAALGHVYKAAYKYSPPEFYSQYAESGTNLKNGVKLLAGALMVNGVGSHTTVLETNAIAKQMIDNFLITKWGLLNPVTHRIQPPTNARAQEAWKLLDDTFSPRNGEIAVQTALLTLMNAPYGYDFNTLTLLFCAWFGLNAKDLKISIGLIKKTQADVTKLVEAGPKEFITKICVSEKLYLARQDLSEFERKALDAINQVDKGGLSIQQAEDLLPDLSKYKSDERFDQARRSSADSAYLLLSQSIGEAKKHQEEAERIKKSIAKARDLTALLELQEEVKGLPACSTVLPSGAKRTELVSLVQDRLKNVVENTCQDAQGLDDALNYGLYKSQLESLRKQLNKERLMALVERVDAALQILDVQLAKLERTREEKLLRQTIDAMDYRNAGLDRLYKYQAALEAMDNLSAVILAIRDNKLKSVKDRIQEIETAAQKVLAEFKEITTLNKLNNWFISFQNYRHRVEDTPLQAEFEATQKACDELMRVLEEIQSIDQVQIKKPADVTSLSKKLEELEKTFETSSVAVVQLLFKKSRDLLNQRNTGLVSEATRTYESIETDFLTGKQKPLVLLHRLETPPIFLPAECVSNWDALRARIKAKMDEDAVGEITQRFEMINDMTKQMECVKQLLNILKQKEQKEG